MFYSVVNSKWLKIVWSVMKFILQHTPPSVISDLYTDIQQGHMLLDLLEVLSGQHLVRQNNTNINSILHQTQKRILDMLSCEIMSDPSGVTELFASNLILHHRHWNTVKEVILIIHKSLQDFPYQNENKMSFYCWDCNKIFLLHSHGKKDLIPFSAEAT